MPSGRGLSFVLDRSNYPGCVSYQDVPAQRLRAFLPPEIEPGHSGYFSKPEPGFDPRLLKGKKLRPEIRRGVLDLLYGFWRRKGYHDPESWSTVWIAGSALSYQWAADRGGLGDLDVLIGIDYVPFFRLHPEFHGIPEQLIAKRFNQEFQELMATTTEWQGFETTFYVNPGATDIRSINPYAAYNLSDDEWTVEPIELPDDWDPRTHFPQEWWSSVNREVEQATRAVKRYQEATRGLQNAPGSPAGVSATHQARHALSEAVALYDDLHAGRKNAFSPDGAGYFDWYNFRWQVHKHAGTEQALRKLKRLDQSVNEERNQNLYGARDISTNRAVLNASLAHTQWRGLR